MKIIYSAGNRIGANTQLSRFLDNIDKTKHQVKTAAYLKSSYSINSIDWCLNSIHKKISYDITYLSNLDHVRYDQKIVNQLINDVADFNPDLIICDDEHILAHIANEMNIPLWYCSPMLLKEGIEWSFRKRINYSYFINIETVNKNGILPQANKYLIYSPFCDFKFKPELKSHRDDDWNKLCKYDWVRPYYKKCDDISINENLRLIELNKTLKYINLKDWHITDGNTSSIADAIYSRKKIIITPSLKNNEALLNSILLEEYKVGVDIGQVELMDRFVLNEIENSMSVNLKQIQLNDNKNLQLHEMINDFEKSLSAVDNKYLDDYDISSI